MMNVMRRTAIEEDGRSKKTVAGAQTP